MKAIVAGSRTILDESLVFTVLDMAVDLGFNITTVLSGTAGGVDTIGEKWSMQRGHGLERFPADWEAYGMRAGFIRNSEMVKEADALVAVWNGRSRGTKDTIDKARTADLSVLVVLFKLHPPQKKVARKRRPNSV